MLWETVEEKPVGNCPHCGKPMLKHITKEGARYHVTSWFVQKHGAYSHCSEPDCENNHGPGQCVPFENRSQMIGDLMENYVSRKRKDWRL
jgi:ssDNA-binding Zn-finger/Zn-ribbon topoisomerase 1